MSDAIDRLEELKKCVEAILPYLSKTINETWDYAYNVLQQEIDHLDETIRDLEKQVDELENKEPDSDLDGILRILGNTHRREFTEYDLEELRGYYASYMRHNEATLV